MRVYLNRTAARGAGYRFQQPVQEGRSAQIKGKAAPGGSDGGRLAGANPLLSLTILDLALQQLQPGGLPEFLGDGRVVIAGLGKDWIEPILPFKRVTTQPSLPMKRSPGLARFIAQAPERFDYQDGRLIVHGRLTMDEENILAWLGAVSPRRLAELARNDHGVFLSAADLAGQEVVATDWHAEHLLAAQASLLQWLSGGGGFPEIMATRYYDGGEREAGGWYETSYRAEQMSLRAGFVANKITLRQLDARNLSAIPSSSVRLYFASGLIDQAIFPAGSADPNKIICEALRVLEPGGILFVEPELDVTFGAMDTHFHHLLMHAGTPIYDQIYAQLLNLQVLTPRETMLDRSFWIKRGGLDLGKFPEQPRQFTPPDHWPSSPVWANLRVVSPDSVHLSRPVSDRSAAETMRGLLRRGFFSSPVVVDRASGKILKGNRLAAAMQKDPFAVGLPVIYSDGNREVELSRLFFTLDKLRMPFNHPYFFDPLYQQAQLEKARKFLAALENDPRFTVRETAPNHYQMELA